MKVVTKKWLSAATREGIILPDTEVLTAPKVVLPQSNLPYQPNVSTNNSGQYLMPAGFRTLTFTVTNSNLIVNPVTVTITGKGLTANANTITSPQKITDTVILDTNIDSVSTTNLFSEVTSFSFNAALPATVKVKVGFGTIGVITHYFDTNTSSPMNYSVQVYPVTGATNFNYQFFTSLIAPTEIVSQYYTTFQYFPDPIVGFPMMASQNNVSYIASSNNLVGVNNTTAYGALSPVNMGWLYINDGSTGKTGCLYLSILQQGLTD